jgi:hypothetical protein
VAQDGDPGDRLPAGSSACRTPPLAGGTPGPIDEPKQLGSSTSRAFLTDEEFAAQKAKILGG